MLGHGSSPWGGRYSRVCAEVGTEAVLWVVFAAVKLQGSSVRDLSWYSPTSHGPGQVPSGDATAFKAFLKRHDFNAFFPPVPHAA